LGVQLHNVAYSCTAPSCISWITHKSNLAHINLLHRNVLNCTSVISVNRRNQEGIIVQLHAINITVLSYADIASPLLFPPLLYTSANYDLSYIIDDVYSAKACFIFH